MKNKVLIVVILFFLLGGFLVLPKRENSQIEIPFLTAKNLVTPMPTPTPTPTPIIIDARASLEEEVIRYAPEDFSSDFTQLKKEASSF